MNGNHDNTATGANMIVPIPASYNLANSRTESHKPRLLTSFFHVIASYIISTNKNAFENVRNKIELYRLD